MRDAMTVEAGAGPVVGAGWGTEGGLGARGLLTMVGHAITATEDTVEEEAKEVDMETDHLRTEIEDIGTTLEGSVIILAAEVSPVAILVANPVETLVEYPQVAILQVSSYKP